MSIFLISLTRECPLEGECLQNEIVYPATVTTRGVTGTTETYVGLTATDFKTRWRNHQMSFKHEKRRNDTELSKYLWKLKEKKEGYSISWKIIAKAKAYSNTTKRCNLMYHWEVWISLVFWATELDTNLSSSICQLASICRYRARASHFSGGTK